MKKFKYKMKEMKCYFGYYGIKSFSGVIYLQGVEELININKLRNSDNLFEVVLENNEKFYITKKFELDSYYGLIYNNEDYKFDEGMEKEKNILIFCSLIYSFLLAKYEIEVPKTNKSHSKNNKSDEQLIYLKELRVLKKGKRSAKMDAYAQVLWPELYFKVGHLKNVIFVRTDKKEESKSQTEAYEHLIRKHTIESLTL